MRITELFTAQSIALDVAAPDQAAIIDKLVDLQATHGNITDKDAYKKALYAREAEASTYVDNGITVPHARTACVTRPSLAALRLSEPVQYNADDDGKTDLLFAIAAPENGSLHIDMLARMMQMLMNEDFVEKLRAAKTPAAFLDAIDAQEDAQFGEESFTEQEIPQNGYRVLAVTACPNGIAHTYMAAEALTKTGDKLGLPTKVETNGSDGAKNILTAEEIAACDGIIIAADKNVETARFDGKPVLFARVDEKAMLAQLEAERADAAAAPAPETAPDTAEPTAQAAPERPEGVAQIGYEDFMKVELRTAAVLACEPVKKAKKLLKLRLDLGYEQRQVVSGIAKWYKPEDLLGKKVIVVANLAPATLCGVESEGMILASGEDTVRVIFLDPETPLGERVR